MLVNKVYNVYKYEEPVKFKELTLLLKIVSFIPTLLKTWFFSKDSGYTLMIQRKKHLNMVLFRTDNLW